MFSSRDNHFFVEGALGRTRGEISGDEDPIDDGKHGKSFEPRDLGNMGCAGQIVELRWFQGVRSVEGQACQTSAAMFALLCRRLGQCCLYPQCDRDVDL
jgi:hypothetical protein